jgi:SWI/SNF-related matrix-associated actin-dependent regulator 1 of chromatin subfamily A
MEMRLGKSLVAIRWARTRGTRLLVVGPLSVIPGWEEELRLEGERRVVPLYDLPIKDRRRIAGTPVKVRTWFVVNYEALRIAPEILAEAWDVVILDESTRIRNPKARITKTLVDRTWCRAKHRAILSGLPAPEGAMDYFCQMKFLYGSFLNQTNFWGFRQRYFKLWGPYEWSPKSGTRDAIKKAVHATAFVLRRKDVNIGSRKIYETRYVSMSPEQAAFYKQIKKEYRFGNLETKFSAVRWLWMARVAGGFSPDQEHPQQISSTKIDELVALLTGELKNESTVVWFRFNEELHAATAALIRAGVDCLGMTGATPLDDRRYMARRFRAGDFPVLLMQVKIGRFGLDLSSASTAIYYSNDYAMEDRYQSEDRIVHALKTDPLLYLDLITKGTVDVSVVSTLRDKSIEAGQFMKALASRLHQQFWEGRHVVETNDRAA